MSTGFDNNDLKMEFDLNDYFTNDSSRDVSFGVPYKPTANATVTSATVTSNDLQQPQQVQVS